MKDNFDLKKFLAENKTFENFNPYTTDNTSEKTPLNENTLRAKIREMILAELAVDENIEEDLDEAKKKKEEEEVEAEEETIADVEPTDSEEFQADTEMDVAPELAGDEKDIMDSLEKALEIAKAKGDEKLIDQIGNTITFFTRQYIVK
jgi:hypothetical protein